MKKKKIQIKRPRKILCVISLENAWNFLFRDICCKQEKSFFDICVRHIFQDNTVQNGPSYCRPVLYGEYETLSWHIWRITYEQMTLGDDPICRCRIHHPPQTLT